MGHLNTLISDLALILVVAGVTTLLFKWLKQPVVLGYIVAGFLVGPHFSFFPTVSDLANINVWSEIGIIVLLFSLGLEFSFRKLVNVGGSAVITAAVIVVGMMLLGYAAGRILHFTYLDSVFLGGMLSMSSTTIIIKAFTDLNMRKQKFTSIVFGVLIVEDMFAVLMMVLLSSIAVNNELEGSELIYSILKLAFFLITWFLVGIFVIPTFLKKARRFLNSETLLVVSMGLCLGMVVLASYAGFSSALGAFVMGSILAGTNEAEKIEKVVQPVKDLFGAVFFISVGMLVDPVILTQYALPIILLSLVVICGQILFGTTGMLISGQPLNVAVKSGFSLSQIGEFAFIIATLGMTLKVIDGFLYPIVVAVSVITTFTTPYFIKMADPASKWIENHLPERLSFLIDRYSANASTVQVENPWKKVLGVYLGKIALYSTILIGILILSLSWFIPMIEDVVPDSWGTTLGVVITLAVMSPFLWGLAMKRINSRKLMSIKENKSANFVPLFLMVILRFLIGLAFVVYFLSKVYSQRTGVLLGVVLFVLITLFLSKRLQRQILSLESRFMDNLNERELRRTGKKNNLVHNMHLAHMEVYGSCEFIGKRLADANIHRNYGVNIVSIKRGNKRINIPKGDSRIFPGDLISVIGTDEQIQRFLEAVEPEDAGTDAEEPEIHFEFERIAIPNDSSLIGKTLAQSGIREKDSCLVVGIEHADGSFYEPTADFLFKKGDMIWIVGEKEKIGAILS
ncbi:cation:proton antiporter [Coprobacter secundus]|uniref:Sodium:proton antiporter n=1 Tax=Coprobacter secundus subsp. similis TaxID=2751153 RepID=A0A7G1HTF2_9BACT|nr:cation:proton antiporter [Coprobacter secundus]BCI62916.1 sodium:proton antiporter [Coprobacter secundus subsp. similis]